MNAPPRLPWPAALAATALAYALAGGLTRGLAIPPGYASPLWPSAGIALASVMVYGRRMLIGVWLGSFLVNALLSPPLAHGIAGLALPAALGVGAVLQAAAGAWATRRFNQQPLALTEPRDVARFFGLGGALACTLSASCGVAALGLTHTVPVSRLASTWWTWWAGDTLGVMIAVPVVFTLLGEPASLWRPRRRSVALPLLAVTALAALLIVQAKQWDEQRAQALFERDAGAAANTIRLLLQQPLNALEAMHGLFIASEEVTGEEFRRASLAWTDLEGAPQALGWSVRVRQADLPAFEREARGLGVASYHVFDRNRNDERLAPSGEEVVAIRYVEPLARNERALGVNALSIPQARAAIEQTRRSDRPAATAGFRLTQEGDTQTGVVVYRAIYLGNDVPEAERLARTRGVVFVTMRMDDALKPALAGLSGALAVCLVDPGAEAAHRRLAGPAGCELTPAAALEYRRPIPFAQREWELRISARDGVPGIGTPETWEFSIVSLLATAALGALLLTMTGRARRIESAVEERTAALQREIGERARTEAALRDSEQRFRNILNHVPIGIFYADLQGYIKQSNPTFRELVGYGADELARLRAVDLTHPDDRIDDDELTRRLVAGEITVYQRKKRYVRQDGALIRVRTIVSLLRDAQGRPHRTVGVVEDITEHLKLQEAQDAREHAESANRAKNDFLSRMSHELRTPLNAMLGFAQLIELDRQQALSESQRDWVGQIQKAGWHLLEMINDTLDLSRIESGTLKLKIEAMDLPQVVAATRAMVERSALARNITITQSLSEDAVQVGGDATRVKQILTNLLSNAVKYNADGGRVHIATRLASGGVVELSVTDTGLGMNEEQLANLFQPFNRLGRERSSLEGTGIGLVISQRLAELMGGRLLARSLAGKGSTFVLELPHALPRAAGPDEAALGDAPLSDYHQRVVHYIEDNETNAVVMEGILAQRPQVKLRVSPTGLDGLAAIRARTPSLILLDMHLPDIDGLQLLRILKDDVSTASIPVVVVSADAVASRIKAALEAGAEYYLTKPVNVSELLRLVDELLEQRDTLFG